MLEQAAIRNPAADRNRKLTFREKFCFGMGDVTGTFGTSVIGLIYLKYLTDILGLGAALAGTVLLITNLYNAVNDPFIGQLSDRTQSKWGRRRLFLLLFAIPTGITYYCCGPFPGNGGSTPSSSPQSSHPLRISRSFPW